jgi:hypothetical protein
LQRRRRNLQAHAHGRLDEMKPHAPDDGSSLGGDDVLRRRAIEPAANAASERGRGRAQVLEVFGHGP